MSVITGNPTIASPQIERLSNGTVVTVGKHQVEILDYMTEGGFAQIYKVKFIDFINIHLNDENEEDNIDNTNNTKVVDPKDIYKDTLLQPGELACLKRVIVQDKNGLNELRNEVNVMQQLKYKPNIVQLFDSNAQRYTKYSPNGFEILLLMELCPNKSLLDYMNQRLATKLSEGEILKIMYDITLAISQMHYLDIPLIHRDIKIENVLVDKQNDFKLCDFGSTSTTFPIVTTHHDIALLSHDIFVHTTPQYRSPEMIDLYKCLPINEKSDIWALGVFLYKLLFFITPFERTGQFAILHSKFEFPNNQYSSKLINLIIIMLSENPNLRPNIYQVMYQLCEILHCPVPLHDKYGVGPYNFDQYMWFQKKSQNLQLQIFNFQNKLRQQNGTLSKEDDFFLNQLYADAFNILPSIPVPQKTSNIKATTDFTNVKTNLIVPEEDVKQSNVVTATLKTSESELMNANIISSKNTPYNNTNTTNNKEEALNELNEVQIFDNQETNIGEKYFPSITELSDYIDRNHEEKLKQKLLQQQQQQQQYVNVEYVNQPATNTMTGTLITNTSPSLIPQSNTTTLKQHKSNNPFPKMNRDFKDGINVQNLSYHQKQQQESINSQISVVTPGQPTHQNQYSAIVSSTQPITGLHGILPPSNEQAITNQDKTPFPPSSSTASNSSVLSSPSPPPVPPHPHKRNLPHNSNQKTEIQGEDARILPEVPPRPMKERLNDSLIDLSSSPSISSTLLEKNPQGNQNSASRDRNLEKEIMETNDSIQLVDPPTTESIEFDLEDVKRKSLDMKLQRLAIESQALQNGTSDYEKQYDDGQKSSDDESITDMKKSFNEQHSSLDLERFNNEIQKDQKKKHKIFSMLRNDRRI